MAWIKQKGKEILEKIRSDKRWQIGVAVVLVGLCLIVFFSQSGLFKKSSTAMKTETKAEVSTDPVVQLENRLSEILSKIEGAGKTDVLITVSSTREKITANSTSTNASTSQNGSGNTVTSTHVTSQPVLVSSGGKTEPYIVQERMPEIVGVIVVAEGGKDPVVRLNVLRAVETALDISADQVEIYSRNNK